MKRYTDEQIIAAVRTSVSVREVMRKIGANQDSGALQRHIRERINKTGVSTKHFLGVRANSGQQHKGHPRSRTAAEILVKGSKREKTIYLRRSLLEIGRSEECITCGLGPEWHGKHLVLQIEHKNGDNTDNRANNLEFMCPNCHSQTSGYAIIKNLSPDKFCAKCGQKIWKRARSGMCHKCVCASRRKRSVNRTDAPGLV